MPATTLSVVIPTYQRGALLLDTLQLLSDQAVQPYQIIVVDQTDYQKGDCTARALQKRHDNNEILWLRLPHPSIPHAMNQGLLAASGDYVLFLDDDVRFSENFIQQHLISIEQNLPVAQVGQIIQPWQQVTGRSEYHPGSGLRRDLHFPFNSDEPADISNCMAGNLVVHRARALQVGGFDENFWGAAYRFETDFCRRLVASSGKPFLFVPNASLDHLHFSSGGTRARDNHLTSISPSHSVGDYYFAMQQGTGMESIRYVVKRLFGCLVAKFYLHRPWFILVRLIAETRGIIAAFRMKLGGRQLISRMQSADQYEPGSM